MLFNSPQFIFIFLPLVFGGYFFLGSITNPYAARAWLASCSLFFYGWWNPRYLPLILISMVINFLIGKYLISHKTKLVLTAGIMLNLAFLGYYKYFDFFLDNFNSLFSTEMPLMQLALPLAISFFTFQQITYIVDCYKGKVDNYHIVNYTLFITFFPHLIAGPIVHHRAMMPQFQNTQNQKINFENIALGIFAFSIGLFKKVILADNFSTTVLDGMQYIETITFFDAWILILSYTFQLYFDFSGYSDMAIGLALLFNIKLPINFNSPYKSVNFQEMASRWHITLTRFLYEYVYFPMNRYLSKKVFPFLSLTFSTDAKTNINLIFLFILSGIWHGAGWNFIIWGLLVGLGIIIYRMWTKTGIKLPLFAAWALTFGYLNFTLVFFKISQLDQAIMLIKAMLGFQGFILPEQLARILHPLSMIGVEFASTPLKDKYAAAGLIILGFIIVLVFKNTSEKMQSFRPTFMYAVFIIIILIYSLLNLTKVSEFLYFKF
ncbi:MBOAT family O-acyltransferase [Candidatus Pristimantibacillus sp. PTI5]|uniref:MBOAT family O-acyltransferase n=1 Tax=Candidatus Pristimantibacillus sp. PTI5 TaxID=3400422 RepID=UPI003B02A623